MVTNVGQLRDKRPRADRVGIGIGLNQGTIGIELVALNQTSPFALLDDLFKKPW